ncbi:MAG: HAMP domain-containing histidine kinase [Anaerolineae bacterium]|nr:HAMP domain-containing histidine kinase [Anaerolineae bacterium]
MLSPQSKTSVETLKHTYELQRQIDYFSNDLLIIQILDGISTMTLLLNVTREVVFANRAFLDFTDVKARKDIAGQHICKLLHCTNVKNFINGDYRDNFCSYCGIDQVIWKALQGYSRQTEAQVIANSEHPAWVMELQVRATPVEYIGERFTLITLSDVSTKKRGEFLERTFLHDVMNTAGALLGAVEVLPEVSETARPRLDKIIDMATHRLVDEITTQQQLRAAERDEIVVHSRPLQTLGFMEDLVAMYANHPVAAGRTLVIDPEAADMMIVTDLTLLNRVLGNLLKNALEASEPGDSVTLGCTATDNDITFWIHNPTSIPQGVQLRLFLHPFSTKGKHRGVGLYSAKLLTERYLQGQIAFTSSPETGTKFTITCPLALPV